MRFPRGGGEGVGGRSTEKKQVKDPPPAPPLEGRGYEHSGCVQCRHIGLFKVDSNINPTIQPKPQGDITPQKQTAIFPHGKDDRLFLSI